MKIWNTPLIVELCIKSTSHGLFGVYRDGGYIGDGQVSGHLTWDKPEEKPVDSSNPS